MDRAGLQVQLPDVSDVGRGRSRSLWSFVVAAAWQPSEAFGLEDLADGDGADGPAVGVEDAADVVDGEVLLAQGDDAIFEGLLLGRGMRSFGSGEEEEALGVLAELAGEDAETAGGVAPALGNLPDREALDEIAAKGLVLAMGGVAGLEEVLGERG